MKICFFIYDIAGKGGTEKMTISLANRLIKDGYDVSIISLYSFRESFFYINENVKIDSILPKKVNNIFFLFYIQFSLFKLVKKNAIDILINVDIIQALFSLPIKFFRPSLKIISWEHFNFKTNLGVKRRDWARILSKKYADAIVTLTEQDKEFYLEGSSSRAIIFPISNFIEELPSRVSLLENKIVLAVGRFTYQKGFDLLIDVWVKVKLSDSSNNWTLKIIGDGNQKSEIQQKIKDRNLESSIKIIDAQENIGDYYLSASIYVMSSRFEGLPMVLIEAMAHGLPIIGFDCLTGPRDLITNNGYLIPLGEGNIMANKICDLMFDAEKRKTMGSHSRENASNFFIDTIILKWKSLFVKLKS